MRMHEASCLDRLGCKYTVFVGIDPDEGTIPIMRVWSMVLTQSKCVSGEPVREEVSYRMYQFNWFCVTFTPWISQTSL